METTHNFVQVQDALPVDVVGWQGGILGGEVQPLVVALFYLAVDALGTQDVSHLVPR